MVTKIKGIIKSIKVTDVIIILAVLVEISVLIFYCKNIYWHSSLNSDAAADYVYGRLLFDEKDDFFISNKWQFGSEIRIISNVNIIAMAFNFTDDYLLVYIFTAVSSYLILFFALLFAIRTIGIKGRRAILVGILMLLPNVWFISQYGILYPAYMIFMAECLILYGIFFQMLQRDISTLKKILVILVSVISGICGVRNVVMFYLPSVVVLFVWLIRTRCWKTFRTVFLYMYLPGAFGFAYTFLYLNKKYGTESSWNFKIKTFNQILNNIKLSIGEIRLLIWNDSSEFLYDRIICFMKFSLILICFVAILVRLIKGKQSDKTIALFAILPSIFVWIISDLIFSSGFSRYIGAASYILIPTGLVFILENDSIEKHKKLIENISVTLVVITIICSMMGTWVKAETKQYYDGKQTREGYINYLLENDYSFGISTYWNSHITTVYSNGKIEVWSTSEELLKYPMWGLAKREWFNKQPEFYLFTTEECRHRIEEGYCHEILYSDDYYVVVSPNWYTE